MSEIEERVARALANAMSGIPPSNGAAMDLARAAIAAMNEWRPIESAPRDGTWIMVAAPNLHPCDAHWERVYDASDWVDAAGPFATQPTHWRPLPAPPEAT